MIFIIANDYVKSIIQCVLVIRESFTKEYGSRVFHSSPCGPLFLHIEPNQLSLVTRTHCSHPIRFKIKGSIIIILPEPRNDYNHTTEERPVPKANEWSGENLYCQPQYFQVGKVISNCTSP